MAFNMKPFDNSFSMQILVIYSETLDVNFSINFQEVIALKQMSKNLKMLT